MVGHGHGNNNLASVTDPEFKIAKRSSHRKRKHEKPSLGPNDAVKKDVAYDEERRKLKKLRKAERRRSNVIPRQDVFEEQERILPAETTKSLPYIENSRLAALPQADIDTFLSTSFITVKDPSFSNHLRPILDFSYLPDSSLTSAFSAFKSPTPIQAAAWPFLFSGRDVVGVAETGSGKTFAFGVPCIQSLTKTLYAAKSSNTPARAVIVSPTRELAVQIHSQIKELATPVGISTACVYGGVPKDDQRLALRKAQVVIATPGRLNDLVSDGSADLSSIQYLVLDEADRMLEKGFEDAIRAIISTVPSSDQGRQTLMFTATWPPSVRGLAATFMNQPVHIVIGEDNAHGDLRANARIEQRVEVIDLHDKNQRLLQLLKQHQSGKTKKDRILIFCLYKKEAARLTSFLASKSLSVAGIHGDLSQLARESALSGFRSGKVPLLVATDVAARGLDIPAVKVVVNYTFPLTVEDYVHRIGRTARAGETGLAVTLFTEHDKAHSGALINVLKAAGQEVPDDLMRFGTTVKKKGHEMYGAFYREGAGEKKAVKIKFDD
ncbi:MAG: hypothetical protein LQ351_000693 [Letrouitia transgressa]|nr:MAG: hypothetical protein LQ351_000693 [Letrouitia transgressa]